MPPFQNVSGVDAVIADCAGVGKRWAEWWCEVEEQRKSSHTCCELSASTIQSAAPAVWPWRASKSTRWAWAGAVAGRTARAVRTRRVPMDG